MNRRSLMLSTLHRIQNPTLRAVWMIRALRANGGSGGGEAIGLAYAWAPFCSDGTTWTGESITMHNNSNVAPAQESGADVVVSPINIYRFTVDGEMYIRTGGGNSDDPVRFSLSEPTARITFNNNEYPLGGDITHTVKVESCVLYDGKSEPNGSWVPFAETGAVWLGETVASNSWLPRGYVESVVNRYRVTMDGVEYCVEYSGTDYIELVWDTGEIRESVKGIRFIPADGASHTLKVESWAWNES